MQIASSQNWMNLSVSANNHFLNTLLIKGSLRFFEPSELIYRLPNVLSFLIYLIYSVKLGKLLRPQAPYIAVILLTAMPFLLDFFSLARGYGLALAFILPSIYFLLKYVRENKFSYALISLATGMLAVISNFSSLNYFMPLLFILIFASFVKQKKIWTRVFSIFIPAAIFLAIIIPLLFQLKNNGEIYFGGRRSFYHDTVLSLSRTFAYHTLNIKIIDVVFSTLFFVLCATAIYCIYRSIRKKSMGVDVVLAALFLLSVLSPIAQHFLFDTLFPTERAALLYYPIQMLLLTIGVPKIFSQIQDKVLTIFAFSFLLLFTFTSNFNHCYSWRFDAGTKEVFTVLVEESGQNESKESISLGLNYLFIPSVWFYQHTNAMFHLSRHEMVNCCEIDLGFEELNPAYYGDFRELKTGLTEENAEGIVSSNMDYYYLHDAVVNELIRYGYSVNVVRQIDYAGSSLITIDQ
jgi:Dolichyl-phosphate-mannose-protein mannosyltransferase